MQDKPLVIAGRTFQSRLIVGTGKYSQRVPYDKVSLGVTCHLSRM